MALIKCPECGKEISDKATSCPYCGYPLEQLIQNDSDASYEPNNSNGSNEQETDFYQQNDNLNTRKERGKRKENSPKKKRNWKVIIIIIIVLIIIGSLISRPSSKDGEEEIDNENTTQTTNEIDSEASDGDDVLANSGQTDWFQYYADEGIEVIPVDADILYQYAEYYSDAIVYTAFTVDSTEKDALKAHTESGSSLVFSIVCYFDDEDEIKGIGEGDAVAVTGRVSEFMGANLHECHLIYTGQEAEVVINELSQNASEQVEYAEEMKMEQEAAEAERDAADKQEYIDACETVSYNDVERNPDDFKGMQIKISGKVVQVAEGIFNSVTLRVQQSDGNIWYVTYSRSDGESRILEGDNVNVYGSCTGITSYRNLAGGQVTIPSMRAKYID